MLLEDLIAATRAISSRAIAVKASETAAFRVTRNWDLNVDEEESEDLLSTIQQELRRRDRGAAVRLEHRRRTPRPSWSTARRAR